MRGVSAGALEVLTRYDWPGNVREMENIIQRSIVLASGPVLQLQDLPLDLAMPESLRCGSLVSLRVRLPPRRKPP